MASTIEKNTYLRVSAARDILKPHSWFSSLDYGIVGIAMGAGGFGMVLTRFAYETYAYVMNVDLSERQQDQCNVIAMYATLVLGIGTIGVVAGTDAYNKSRSDRALKFLKNYKPYEIIKTQDILRLMELSNKDVWEQLTAHMSGYQIENVKIIATNLKIREYLQSKSGKFIGNETREIQEQRLFKSIHVLMNRKNLSLEKLSHELELYKALFGEDYQHLLCIFEDHITIENMKLIHQLGVRKNISDLIKLSERYFIAHHNELHLKEYFN